MGKVIIKMILFAMMPISELRGAIPFGYFNNINIFLAYFISVFFNFLASLLLFIFLDTINNVLLKIKIYKKFFDKVVNRAKIKVGNKFEKYEYWGLMLFVAIPLPVTGAWTGTIGAWVLGLNRKKSLIFILLGVIIAGLIVSIITYTGAETFKLFIKQVK